MKVYPISLIQFHVEKGAQTAQLGAVQTNVDANAGLPPAVYERPGMAALANRIAVVGYGPSLVRTWEELRKFEAIWTVSGAHDFLLKRGIVPTYHTDVDWRPHKANFIKRPSASVTYYMANVVHPKYIDKLRDGKLFLFQPVGYDTGHWLTLDDAYPQVKMPGDVSMVAIEQAVLMGYTDIHVFGVDGSHQFDGTFKTERGLSHAGPHDGAKSPIGYVTDLDFELYETSENLLKQCDAFYTMAQGLPDGVHVTVNSDGLLPAWLKMREVKDSGKAKG